MADGVVLNIMFNKMWYSDEYDLAIATFKVNENKYSKESMRLNYMPQKQICVKNHKEVN